MTFGNNMRIVLLEFIPGLGSAIMVSSAVQTGRLAAGIAAFRSAPWLPLIVNGLSAPDGWVELLAYSIASTQSLYMAYYLFKRRFGQNLHRSAIALFVVVCLLAVAAVGETLSIAIGTYGRLVSFGIIFVAGALAYLLLRRSKAAKPLRSPLPAVPDPH
jgi:uncharacterized membrane protein SpoIIM required for sporulation